MITSSVLGTKLACKLVNTFKIADMASFSMYLTKNQLMYVPYDSIMAGNNGALGPELHLAVGKINGTI